MKDINLSPCRWHMRIWDVDKNEWLHANDMNYLPYYGFDIRGGEVTAIQGMREVYNAFAHGKEFIWEQSTGLKDKNGKEIYEGDIVANGTLTGIVEYIDDFCAWTVGTTTNGIALLSGSWTVIGNIHENPELLGGEE